MEISSYALFGLSANPFGMLPPNRDDDIRKVFVGRKDEIETLSRLCSRPIGIFLFGMFGIGKSILIREYLRRMRDKGARTIYTKFDRFRGFSGSILPVLACICAEKDINSTYNILMLGDRGKKRKPTPKDITLAATQVQNPLSCIRLLISEIAPASPIIIGVDDLDKDTEIQDIHNVIMETRHLIEMDLRILLPGHSVGVTAEFSSSTDILYPVHVNALQKIEYVEMIQRYLALSRSREMDLSPYPFTNEAANLVAEVISECKLTPRLLNFACMLLLDEAAKRRLERIDEEFIRSQWTNIANNYLLRSLKDEDRKYLEVIYRDEGFLSEDTRDKIEAIAGPLGEFREVKDKFREMVIYNIVLESSEGGKPVYRGNPLMILDKIFVR